MSSAANSDPYMEAIQHGFGFARALGLRCAPAHLLVGVADGRGAAATALRPGAGRQPIRALVAALPGTGAGDGAGARPGSGGYVQMQAQSGALGLAKSRNQHVSPEHLLIALIDQATGPVLDVIRRAGLDPAEVRQAATAAIGAPGLPPIELPPLTPAGTLDRPPLPVAELNDRAWTWLRWRQDHLPIDRLRRPADREALLHLERAATWQLADRLSLGDDQRYSLLSQHDQAVAERVNQQRPGLDQRPSREERAGARAVALTRRYRRWRRYRIFSFSLRNVTVGWAAWFGNRRVGLRDRWFRLRTMSAYRGAPQP